MDIYNYSNQPKEIISVYFIESHLKKKDNSIEITLDSSPKMFGLAKSVNPFRLQKIFYKEAKNDKINKDDEDDEDDKNNKKDKNEPYIISVYRVDVKPRDIKTKDIMEVNKVPSTPLKVILKMGKNKFEASTIINLRTDSFKRSLSFESHHNVFKDDASPPEQLKISEAEALLIFHEVLTVGEKKQIYDPTYISFLSFALGLMKGVLKCDFKLYTILFIGILKGNNTYLIKQVLDRFIVTRIGTPNNRNELFVYRDQMYSLYNERFQMFEKIKKIKDVEPTSYLTKFLTFLIYFFSVFENYDICENMMRELNPLDDLLLARLYISDYSQILKKIPISPDLLNNLMGKLIYSANDYKTLLNSFTVISENIKKDVGIFLLVISGNYEKIDELCRKAKSSIKIKDYVTPTPNDDLNKIRYYLEIITQKMVSLKYRAIVFDLSIWEYYL